MPPTWIVFQLSFDPIRALLELKIPRVGLAKASAIPKALSDGPIARTTIFLVELDGPWTMIPSIKTLSPVPTGRRVETLTTRPGEAVGVAVGVALGFAVAVAVALGVAVAVGLTVAIAVAVAVGLAAAAVGVGVGVVGTIRPAENSEVFPTASMALDVTIRPLATETGRDTLTDVLPLAFVVVFVKPRNCWPSAGDRAALNRWRRTRSGTWCSRDC